MFLCKDTKTTQTINLYLTHLSITLEQVLIDNITLVLERDRVTKKVEKCENKSDMENSLISEQG